MPKPKQAITKSTKDRLLEAGALLFAQKGFAGVSVREICQAADASQNMIHHYFGSKDGLYQELIAHFSEEVLLVPIRIIESIPNTREECITRLELFVAETLEALIKNRLAYSMVRQDNTKLPDVRRYGKTLMQFLEGAKKKGFVRKELDSEMLTGLIMDRLGNQVFYADCVQEFTGKSVLSDERYKKRWLKANSNLFLFGAIESEK